jgi:hypothetical protein
VYGILVGFFWCWLKLVGNGREFRSLEAGECGREIWDMVGRFLNPNVVGVLEFALR